MKYASIDVETTGLEDDAVVLEVGVVVDDFESPLDKLPRFRILFPRNRYLVDSFIMEMHQELFKELDEFLPELKERITAANRHEELFKHSVGSNPYKRWIEVGSNTYAVEESSFETLFHSLISQNYLPTDKLVVAGKNFYGFDYRNLDKIMPKKLVKFHHRALDPCALYLDPLNDEVPPSLEECLKRAGLKPTGLHTAIGDALDVIKLLRAAKGKTKGFYASAAQEIQA